MTHKKRGLNDNPLFTKTEQERPATLLTPSAGEEFEHLEPAPLSKAPHDPMGIPVTPTNTPTDQLTGQLTAQSTNPLAEQSTSPQSLSIASRQILNRPTSFYLYKDQSEDLDNLVNLLKKEYKLKTDRSALLRAILSEPVLNYHRQETHRALVERVIQQSMSRLISQ